MLGEERSSFLLLSLYIFKNKLCLVSTSQAWFILGNISRDRRDVSHNADSFKAEDRRKPHIVKTPIFIDIKEVTIKLVHVGPPQGDTHPAPFFPTPVVMLVLSVSDISGVEKCRCQQHELPSHHLVTLIIVRVFHS